MSAELYFVLTDRQTNGQTALRSLRLRIQYSAVMSIHTDVIHDEVTKKKKVSKAVNNQCTCCRNIEVATEVQAVACCDATPLQLCATKKIKKTRKRAIAKALHLEGRTTSRQMFWVFRVCLVSKYCFRTSCVLPPGNH